MWRGLVLRFRVGALARAVMEGKTYLRCLARWKATGRMDAKTVSSLWRRFFLLCGKGRGF